MIEFARVISRGLAPDDGSTQKIERRHGHRNGTVQTKDGRRFHIHDKSCHMPMWGWPDWVPHFNPFISNLTRFPQVGNWVVLETDNAAPKHGRTLEVVAWCRKKDYEATVGQSIGGGRNRLVPWQTEPAFRKFIMSLIDFDTKPRDPESTARFAKQLIEFCQLRVNKQYLGGVVSHYVAGESAQRINQQARTF